MKPLVSIQLLRAIAAVGVVYAHSTSHTFPEINFGWFGVDIFFIISGFIITFVVSNNTEKFLLKRIIRVVPLYWIATLLTIVVCLLFPQLFYNTSISIPGIIKSFLFIPYKIGTSGPILLLGWTLNCEMFFYLIMALCIYFVKNKKYITITSISVLLSFIVLLNLIKSESYIIWFYKDRALLFEFIYGITLYHIYMYFTKIIPPLSKNPMMFVIFLLVGVISFLFLVFSDIYTKNIYSNKNIQTGIPALMFVTAILFLENTIKTENIFVKFGQKLGDASYAMYLFHPFIIYFLQRVIYPKIFGDSENIIIKFIQVIICLIITMICSIILYHCLDNPLQKKLKVLIKNK